MYKLTIIKMNDKLALTIYALRIRNFLTNLALCMYNRYVSLTNLLIMSNPHNTNKPIKYFRIRILTKDVCVVLFLSYYIPLYIFQKIYLHMPNPHNVNLKALRQR